MSYSELIAGTANRKKRLRVGRGNGRRGKTCGRGHRGVGQRTGPGVRATYEGGQTPSFRRLPKRGFSNAQYETRYVPVNVADLNRFPDGATVDKTALAAVRLIRKASEPVKILGSGTLQRKLDVVADKFSAAARAKIEAAGGSARGC
jgi:large subunit ribosomal protein L15